MHALHERTDRRMALRAAAATLLAVAITVTATLGVAPGDGGSAPPVRLSFVDR